MEEEKDIAIREVGLMPKCHMKPMQLKGMLPDVWWECSVCNSKKEYEKEEEMIVKQEENIIPEEAEENSDRQIIDIHVNLTDGELLEIGDKIGELDAEEDTLTAEKKAAVSMWTAKLNGCKAEKKALCKMLKTKTEIRTIECHVDPDYDTGVMCYVSVETGVIVHQRKMTNEERQMKLFVE